MTLKLDKVNRGPHLSTLVASSISREIAQGRLKPGDQLPTEQALATTFGVVQNSVESHRRATATALLYIILNVVSLGGGPLFTGWVIDHSGPSPADATRHGLLVLGIFYAWASAHYFRASSVQSDSM